MASFNPFGALDSDNENDIPVAATTRTKASSSNKGNKSGGRESVSSAGVAKGGDISRSERPRRDGRGGRSAGRGEGHGTGGRFDGEGGERSAPERESFDDRRRERGGYGHNKHSGDRGGRMGYTGRDGRNREYDRRSGTGRGREMKKRGGGGRNWGNDASAGIDNAEVATEAGNGEGGWRAEVSNGTADLSTEGTGWDAATDPAPFVDFEAGDGNENDATQAEETVVEPANEPEPEEVQLTLDEHQALLDKKAKELADIVGEVSINTVDTSEFDQGAMRNKTEIEEEGYLGGQTNKKARGKHQQRAKNVFQNVGFRPPPMNSGGRGRGRGGRGRGGGRFNDRPHRPYGERNDRNSQGGDGVENSDWRGNGGRGSHNHDNGGEGSNEDSGFPRSRHQGGGGARGRFDRDSEGYGHQAGGGGGYQESSGEDYQGGSGYNGNGTRAIPLNLKDDDAFPSL